MAHGLALAAANIEPQRLAALDEHSQDLLYRVALRCQRPRDMRDERDSVRAQQCCRTRRPRMHSFYTEHFLQELIGHAAACRAVVRELAAVVLPEGSRVAIDGLDPNPVADR